MRIIKLVHCSWWQSLVLTSAGNFSMARAHLVTHMSPHGGSKDNCTMWLFQGQYPKLNDLTRGSEFTLSSNLLYLVYTRLTTFTRPTSELGA